jgi:hypothetical protein
MKTLRLTAVVMTVLFVQSQVSCGGWLERSRDLDEKHVVENYLNYTKDHLQGSLRIINHNAQRIKAINKRTPRGPYRQNQIHLGDIRELNNDMIEVNRELESMYPLFVRVIRRFSDVAEIQDLDQGFNDRVEQFKSLIENKARDFTSITNLMNRMPRPTPSEINYLIDLIKQAYKVAKQAQQNCAQAKAILEPIAEGERRNRETFANYAELQRQDYLESKRKEYDKSLQRARAED